MISTAAGQKAVHPWKMKLMEKPSFDALKFITAQINPHYNDFIPKGFHGETRDQRLQEFCTLNPSTPVLAIKEGSALHLANNTLRLLGEQSGFVFHGNQKHEITKATNLSEYL